MASRITNSSAIKTLGNSAALGQSFFLEEDDLSELAFCAVVKHYFAAVTEVLRHTPSLQTLEMYLFGTGIPSLLTETIHTLPIVSVTISRPGQFYGGESLESPHRRRGVTPSVSDLLLIARHCPNLVNLSSAFDDREPMATDFAKQLQTNCPHLTSLELRFYPSPEWLEENNNLPLCLGTLQCRLRSLILHNIYLRPEQVLLMKSLEILVLTFSHTPALPYSFHFVGADRLERLVLNGSQCQCVFQRCANLTLVDIGECKVDGISVVFEDCPCLEHVCLSSNVWEETDGVIGTIHNCGKLEEIYTNFPILISECSAIQEIRAHTVSPEDLKGITNLRVVEFTCMSFSAVLYFSSGVRFGLFP
mmetsp:Transcript_6943/g.10938  ORF Transcript_6943/g.10938 Transcript_6943/m.10938 type:complete len:362 (-) Transcript_6943:487-1572(-)|eukprot:CAMPEP_0184675960 /NCGR_PEP_ID=MMETSP0308-20130426/88092_1 /TAXON_ID=38269 /ORGANISM="Gloeochaete witrockiana, Strain SAG 46.84" /LENGTH=361 /DNA_ID=CAMNT_0027123757 /DNA_START=849 /DNA_END=1934 /DNA_ORIENTATION=+